MTGVAWPYVGWTDQRERERERDLLGTGSRERTWGFLVYTLHLDSDSDAGYAVLPRDSR